MQGGRELCPPGLGKSDLSNRWGHDGRGRNTANSAKSIIHSFPTTSSLVLVDPAVSLGFRFHNRLARQPTSLLGNVLINSRPWKSHMDPTCWCPSVSRRPLWSPASGKQLLSKSGWKKDPSAYSLFLQPRKARGWPGTGMEHRDGEMGKRS